MKNAVLNLRNYLSEKCSNYYSDYRYKEYYLTSDVRHNFFLDGIKKNLEERMKMDIHQKTKFCLRLQKFEKLLHIFRERHREAGALFERQVLGEQIDLMV